MGDAARRIREERKEQQAVQEEMARRVLQLSGLEKQIDEFPKTISEALKGQMARMDSRFSERYRQAMLASFTSSKIRSAFTDVFNRQMGYAGLAGVLPWYESPVGRKIYSTLSEAELEQYVQFLSSPHGQTMTRAVWSGFEHSFEAAGAEVATRLVALPPEQP